jgi:hypothetical protein
VFEDRVLLSSVPALYSSATGELTDPAFNGKSYANTLGLTATVPTLSGNQIVFGFTNSGPHTITIGIATYNDPPGAPPLQLSSEVFQSVQYITIAPHSSKTVYVCDQCQVQMDAFINKVDCTTVSNVVHNFSPYNNNPTSNAGPPVDAGYNYNPNTGAMNYQPTSSSSTPPNGILGTLLSFTVTTSCNCGCQGGDNGGDCGDDDGGDDDGGDCGDGGDDDGGDCGNNWGGNCGSGNNRRGGDD